MSVGKILKEILCDSEACTSPGAVATSRLLHVALVILKTFSTCNLLWHTGDPPSEVQVYPAGQQSPSSQQELLGPQQIESTALKYAKAAWKEVK